MMASKAPFSVADADPERHRGKIEKPLELGAEPLGRSLASKLALGEPLAPFFFVF